MRPATQDLRFEISDTRLSTPGLMSHVSCLMSYVLCLVSCIAWINPQADKTEEGNRLYNKESYDEAMTKYTEVLVHQPNSPYLHFNIGNAAYKKENYEEAAKSYTKTASLATDRALEGKAYYNLGNCKYRQGKLKENTNLGETISLYREALEYYKQALDKNPKDTDAKYNHEFVERKIKELLDKQKQQQQQQNQQQTEDQQGRQSQENQSERDDKSEAEDQGTGQDQAQAAQAQQADQEEQKGEQESDQKKKLTAEEAKMLLDSLKDEELSQLQRRKSGSLPRVLKDW